MKKAETIVQQLSITAELTRLNNRRGFFLLAEQQLKLAHRVNTSVCLVFVDLDGLKQVNDGLGHEIGNRLVADAAQVLKQTFRQSDVIARLGGDEFAVLLPGCAAEDDVFIRLQESVTLLNKGITNPSTIADCACCK